MRFQFSGLRAAFLFLLAAVVCASAQGQTNVALSLYGAFTNTTTPGNSDFFRMNPAASAGGLLEFRHISSSLLGWEGTYSFRRANEVYEDLIGVPASSGCERGGCNFTYAVSANAQELTADWVPSGHIASFRPFAVIGVGLLLNQPVGNQNGTASTVQPAFVYGAGLDWRLIQHFGLRLQYRGNLYKAPGIVPPNNTNPNVGFMHTAEPAIGFYYRF